ncbi:hypothetical protein PC129_g11689, partial [Phytophthora cactorum]
TAALRPRDLIRHSKQHNDSSRFCRDEVTKSELVFISVLKSRTE